MTILFPEILDTTKIQDGIILAIRIPQNLAYFIGHFDQISIVPGVVQIHWAVHYAQIYLGLNAVFSHMEAIKFKELLLSEQPIKLELRYQFDTQKLVFCYFSETAEYSSGRIYFHDI